MLHVTCHMSNIPCHMSCVTCYFFLQTKWWSLLVEGLLSTGPTQSSWWTFIILHPSVMMLKMMMLTISVTVSVSHSCPPACPPLAYDESVYLNTWTYSSNHHLWEAVTKKMQLYLSIFQTRSDPHRPTGFLGHFSVGYFFLELLRRFLCNNSPQIRGKSAQQLFDLVQPTYCTSSTRVTSLLVLLVLHY